jgi:hypothetical protein
MNTNHDESPFGEVIYSYTRSQAVADGVQVEVTKTAQEAGIRFPVFITRTAFDAYVTVPPNVTGQDEAGRLWDIVWMLRFAIRKAQPGQARLPFCALCAQRQLRPTPNQTDCDVRPPRHGRPATRHHGDDAGRGLTAPGTRTRLDLPQFSSFFLRLGTIAVPKPPALGFTPAQARAKGHALMDSTLARAGLDAVAPFPAGRKGNGM